MITHEVGHHVQNLLGILPKVQRVKRGMDEADVEAAMRTAAAIGDDRLQRRGQGHVVPDACTHGSSEQRVHLFMTGLKSGQLAAFYTSRRPTPDAASQWRLRPRCGTQDRGQTSP